MVSWISVVVLSATTAVAEPVYTEPPSTAKEMRNHWSLATGARDAVIHGDLAGARVLATGLAEHRQPGTIPRKSRPLYAQMQVAALELSRAADLQSAGEAVGVLGATCGECHSFTGGGPRHHALPEPPAEVMPMPGDMKLHQYGADMLWLSLVTANPDAWTKGAEALANATFDHNQPGRLGSVDLRAMEHIAHLVPALADTYETSDMATRFGQTLTACAMCHNEAEAYGLKPDSRPDSK